MPYAILTAFRDMLTISKYLSILQTSLLLLTAKPLLYNYIIIPALP